MVANKIKQVNLKEKLAQYLADISNGKLTIVNQDGEPIQFNINRTYTINKDKYDSNKKSGIKALLTSNELKYIESIVNEIKFGYLAITLKDGEIDKIEREEKIRL